MRTPVTDPANGLRAFRVEVTERVPLRQPQYQTSELLIGAIAHGFRIREVPATVYARRAGTSKKGGNFSYGMRSSRGRSSLPGGPCGRWPDSIGTGRLDGEHHRFVEDELEEEEHARHGQVGDRHEQPPASPVR